MTKRKTPPPPPQKTILRLRRGEENDFGKSLIDDDFWRPIGTHHHLDMPFNGNATTGKKKRLTGRSARTKA